MEAPGERCARTSFVRLRGALRGDSSKTAQMRMGNRHTYAQSHVWFSEVKTSPLTSLGDDLVQIVRQPLLNVAMAMVRPGTHHAVQYALCCIAALTGKRAKSLAIQIIE